VENAFGEVRVFKGEPGKLKLRVRKVVFAQSEEAARAFAASITMRAELSGGTLRVTSNRRELEQSNDTGFETHLYIEAPPGTLVKVQNEHGAVNLADVAAAKVWNSYEPVRVERVAGPADVDSRHGDVFAEKIDGALSIYTRYGNVDVRDAAKAATLTVEHGDMMVARVASLKANAQYSDVSAEDVAGELVLNGKHASLKASRIKGRAIVDTTYRSVTLRTVEMDVRVKTEHGALTADALGGALNVEASYDDVGASDVAGPVDVRVVHGGFKGSQLRQGARVHASGDDVEIRGFEGPIEIETQRGGVRLSPDKAIVDGVSVVASRGAIHLEVPAGSRFDLEAAATRGEVQVDLPELTINESSSSRVKAKLGTGGKVPATRSLALTADLTDDGRISSTDARELAITRTGCPLGSVLAATFFFGRLTAQVLAQLASRNLPGSAPVARPSSWVTVPATTVARKPPAGRRRRAPPPGTSSTSTSGSHASSSRSKTVRSAWAPFETVPRPVNPNSSACRPVSSHTARSSVRSSRSRT
jgi:DUF4097 and DUF4098 domain-containing protein YvlB